MLRIVVLGSELFDEEKEVFIKSDEDFVLDLEHSLISLSKWESKFEKPFLGDDPKTNSELYEYIKMMVLTTDVPDEVYTRLSKDNLSDILKYIDSKQSATIFGEMPKPSSRGETITAELIYYWMVAFTIPFECEKWHLNRLFSLIRICNIKSSKPQKMSKTALAQRNRTLNAQRRAKLGSRG